MHDPDYFGKRVTIRYRDLIYSIMRNIDLGFGRFVTTQIGTGVLYVVFVAAGSGMNIEIKSETRSLEELQLKYNHLCTKFLACVLDSESVAKHWLPAY